MMESGMLAKHSSRKDKDAPAMEIAHPCGMVSSLCPRCGGDNRCTMNASCWCMNKPRTAPVPATGACLCERCLERASAV